MTDSFLHLVFMEGLLCPQALCLALEMEQDRLCLAFMPLCLVGQTSVIPQTSDGGTAKLLPWGTCSCCSEILWARAPVWVEYYWLRMVAEEATRAAVAGMSRQAGWQGQEGGVQGRETVAYMDPLG